MARQRLVPVDSKVDSAPMGLPSKEQYVQKAIADLPTREARRYAQKRTLKLRQTTIQRPITMEDVPPGSVLSDRTLQMIAEGKVAIAQDKPVSLAPVFSKAPLRKRRKQMAKQSRKHNRKK